jgi:sugar/nucleoside kinase (ribokinase family)
MAQTRKEWDVITAGDVFVDIVLSGFPAWPQPGEEVFAERMHREAGGGAAITACGLAKLGARVAALASVGIPDGDWLIERISDCGVDPRLIHRHANGATGVTVSVSTVEDRAFFTYPGANQGLPALLVDPQVWRDLARARHVHVACPMDPDLLAELAAFLHAQGCRVSLDVGWQTAWLKDARSLAALREVDLFFPNEREGRLMTGESEPEAVLRTFDEAGLRGVALKLGEQGSLLLYQREIIRCAPHAVAPVETTGAGDSFNAGFIFAWLQGESPMRRLQLGNVCGALSTRGHGGIATFPTRDEIWEGGIGSVPIFGGSI